jgi:hypothetical protein
MLEPYLNWTKYPDEKTMLVCSAGHRGLSVAGRLRCRRMQAAICMANDASIAVESITPPRSHQAKACTSVNV